MYSEIFVVFLHFFSIYLPNVKGKLLRMKKRGWLATAFLSYKIPAKVIRDKVVSSLIDMWL
jgi:hypothetical protein